MANIYHKSTDYVSYVVCDGTAMIQPWTGSASGAGSSLQAAVSDASRFGITTLSTGTTTTGRYNISQIATNSFGRFSTRKFTLEATCAFPVQSTTTQVYNALIGFSQSGTSPMTQSNIEGFVITTAGITCRVTNAGVTTIYNVPTPVFSIDTYYKFKVERIGVSEIKFYINDLEIVGHGLAGVPTLSLTPVIGITKAGGTTARILSIDNFKLTVNNI